MTDETTAPDPVTVHNQAVAAATLRAAQLAALSTSFAEAFKEAKLDLEALMNVRDTARPTIPGTDTVAATVSYKAGSDAIRVTDSDALTAWVDENYPGEVESIERIRPAFMQRFVNANGVVVGPGGELDIPGIKVLPSSDPSVAVTVPKAARPMVLESIRALTLQQLLGGQS